MGNMFPFEDDRATGKQIECAGRAVWGMPYADSARVVSKPPIRLQTPRKSPQAEPIVIEQPVRGTNRQLNLPITVAFSMKTPTSCPRSNQGTNKRDPRGDTLYTHVTSKMPERGSGVRLVTNEIESCVPRTIVLDRHDIFHTT